MYIYIYIYIFIYKEQLSRSETSLESFSVNAFGGQSMHKRNPHLRSTYAYMRISSLCCMSGKAMCVIMAQALAVPK